MWVSSVRGDLAARFSFQKLRLVVTLCGGALLGMLRGRFASDRRAPEPRRRAEGVYLAQLTCGRARCSFRISVRVDGPLEVSLAAHRPVLTTEALENLRRDLPPWAVGAEWGKFVSELVLRSV